MTEDNSQVLPEFIIAAAAKSGTTSLRKYLADHPQLYLPSGQTDYFRSDDCVQHGAEGYAECFKDAPADRMVGAHNPFYYTHSLVAGRMKTVLPEVKIIWVLRDPISRAYSHYWFNITRGIEQIGCPEIFNHERWETIYKKKSGYADYMDPWFEAFPREQMMFVLSEDLKFRKEDTLSNVCSFLGVDNCYAFTNLAQNARETTLPKNIALHRKLMANRTKWGPLVTRLCDSIIAANTMSAPGYPALPDEERSRLVDHFAPKNERLVTLTGLDISVWS